MQKVCLSNSALFLGMVPDGNRLSGFENHDIAIMRRDEQIKKQGEQIKVKNEQIKEQNSIILSSAKSMKESGMSVEQIAAITRLSIDEINAL